MLLERKIRVGIIDSGINPESRKLPNTDIEAIAIEPGKSDGIFHGNQYRDHSWHGTVCAEIITSIAPEVSLCVAKVLNEKNYGYGSALISALEWMATKKVSIINLSLGTTNSKYLERLISAINLLNAQNTVLISAAFWKTVYPASIPSIIAVADDRLFLSIPQNRVKRLKIDFAARIPDAIAHVSNHDNALGSQKHFCSSFATPYVTGLAALIIKNSPRLTVRDIYRLITLSAEHGKFLDFQENPFLKEVLSTNSFSFDKLRNFRQLLDERNHQEKPGCDHETNT